ncbi:ribonuclease P protein component [Desulfuromonas versatilis]|uniref:Ribonuclease P protein component n=1 Tax=Desulfuromonas versatilis TaxID=2802975 RepID=A0ABM9SDB1_9BACT|nr:ribonuclease P protein component [Desulfuromonas versatilis]
MAGIEEGRLTFPSRLRLRERFEFNRAWAKGQKRHTAHFIVLILEKSDGPTRLGLTVSRKVGGAVSRNRVKRIVREFFRTQQNHLPPGIDLSIIAKKGACRLTVGQLCEEFKFLLVR